MNNGNPRCPVSGRGLPLLIYHFTAEMGIGVSSTVIEINNRHPRGDLIEDPYFNTLDSVLDTYGMTEINTSPINTYPVCLNKR